MMHYHGNYDVRLRLYICYGHPYPFYPFVPFNQAHSLPQYCH